MQRCEATTLALAVAVIFILLLSPLSAGATTVNSPKPHVPSQSATLTVGPSTTTLGNMVYLNVTVSGDSPPYIYSYSDLSGTSGCAGSGSTVSFTNSWSDTCTPTSTGSFIIEVGIADSVPNIFTATAPLQVNPAPLSISAFLATPSAFDLGNSTSLSVSASGGTPAYNYTYAGLPPGCYDSFSNVLSCTPTQYGSFDPVVFVNDSAGGATSASTSVNVSPAPLTITSFVATPNPVYEGATTFLNVTPAGGFNQSGYTYSYAGLPTGCNSASTKSLVCVPSALGTFPVTVTVVDGNGNPAFNTTSLVVDAAPLTVPVFTASPNPALVNQTVHFTVTASGGAAPYSYSYTGLPAGCVTANSTSLSCTPSVAGNFTVTVDVVDLAKTSVTRPLALAVYPTPLVIATFTPSPANFNMGNSTNLTVTASGGTTPYNYVYVGLPTGCKTADSKVLTCKPTVSGTFTVRVYVNDSGMKSENKTVAITINPAPLVIKSFTATPATFILGNSTTFSVTASGGVAPYAYTYAYSNLPPGCTSSNVWNLTCTPKSSGNYSVLISVTDSAKAQANSTKDVLVTGTSGPLSVSISTSATSVAAGTPFTLTAQVSGGVGPFQYKWVVNNQNATSSQTSPTWVETLSTPGIYNIQVWVVDSTSAAALSPTPAVVHVTANNGVGNTPSTPFPWWILVVVLAVALVLAYFAIDRRRKLNKAAEAEAAAAEAGPLGAAALATTGSGEPGSEGQIGPDGQLGAEAAVADGIAGPSAWPATELPSGQESGLTQCPQCQGTLGPDMSCPTCRVTWTPAQGTEAPVDQQPSTEGSQQATEESQVSTEDAEPEPSEPVQTVETVVIPKAAAPTPPPEPSKPESVAEVKPEAAVPKQEPAAEVKAEPAAPKEEPSSIEDTPEAREAAGIPNNCMVCGSPLKGDYCSLCDMHWAKEKKG